MRLHPKESMIADTEDGLTDVVELYWDSTYAIAMALIEQYPHLDPVEVGLEELAGLVEALPGFQDDPAFVTERILKDIQITWYEEMTLT